MAFGFDDVTTPPKRRNETDIIAPKSYDYKEMLTTLLNLVARLGYVDNDFSFHDVPFPEELRYSKSIRYFLKRGKISEAIVDDLVDVWDESRPQEERQNEKEIQLKYDEDVKESVLYRLSKAERVLLGLPDPKPQEKK